MNDVISLIVNEWGIIKFIIYTAKILSNYYSNINLYLSDKNDDLFLSSVFSWLWAASIWALAIIFSISLFAVQQGYSTYSQGAIDIFLKDKVSKIVYFAIWILIIVFYGLSFLDKTSFFKDNLFLLVILLLFWLIAISGLIWMHYQRVTKIISPKYIIEYFWNTWSAKIQAIKEQKNLSELINIIPVLKNDIEEITNIIKKYQQRKEYSVVASWLKEIILFSIIYIDCKWSLLNNNENIYGDSFFEDLDWVFEKLYYLFVIASKDWDIEIIRRVIYTFEDIITRSLELNWVNDYFRRRIFDYWYIFLERMVEKEWKNLPDVLIQVSEAIKRIIPHVFSSKFWQLSNLYNAEKISRSIFNNGLLSSKNSYFINDWFEILLLIIWNIIISKEYTRHNLSIFMNKLEDYLYEFVENSKQYSLIDIENFRLLDKIFWELSLDNLIIKICNDIWEEKNHEIKNYLMKKLLEVNEEFYRLYRKVLKKASINESILIVKISNSTRRIIIRLIKLLSLDWINRDKIISDIKWYFANYRRIYRNHSRITENYIFSVKEAILELGIEFHKRWFKDLIKETIDTLFAIMDDFSQKEIEQKKAPWLLLTIWWFALYVKEIDYFFDCLEKNGLITDRQWKLLILSYKNKFKDRNSTWKDPEDYIRRNISLDYMGESSQKLFSFLDEKWIDINFILNQS